MSLIKNCLVYALQELLVPFLSATVAIPISVIIQPLLRLYKIVRNALAEKNSPERHAQKVKYVQEQVLDWVRAGKKTRLCSARPQWRKMLIRSTGYRSKSTGIDLSHLNDVIEIDAQKQIVRVEPMTSMGKLSALLIPKGWVVPVIPEFKDLTVGGLINGTGIETSSHKYGDFQYVAVEFEIVLADGRVVTCSKDKDPHLFHAIPMSHGTLGFLTSASLMIIPAKRYVKLEYIPAHSLDEIVSTLEELLLRENNNDFVEGIMYSLNTGVLMVGNMVDQMEADGIVNSVDKPYKPWFFKHVATYLSKSKCDSHVEYIPLRDYIHRHNNGLFWSMHAAAPFLNLPVVRHLFGWCIFNTTAFSGTFSAIVPSWFKDKVKDIAMVQDYVVPLSVLKETLILAHNEVAIYPVWLCGTRILKSPGVNDFTNKVGKMYVDIGLYGKPATKHFDKVKTTKLWEKFCIKHQGHGFTYSDVYMSREEFEKMYNMSMYYKARKEFQCETAFPDVFEKIEKCE